MFCGEVVIWILVLIMSALFVFDKSSSSSSFLWIPFMFICIILRLLVFMFDGFEGIRGMDGGCVFCVGGLADEIAGVCVLV